MIRDLNQSDKIKYAKAFIDKTPLKFLQMWFCNPEGMFEDIDFYVAKTLWHGFTLKAKISGTICGLLVLPFIFLTFVLVLIVANVCRTTDTQHKKSIPVFIGHAIVFTCLLFPFALIRFPFSLYSYFMFKKRALFYLLEVDSDYDTSSE